MNSRWNIVLVVIALAVLGWYYSLNQHEEPDLTARIQTSDSPDYTANKMETTLYSIDGRKQYVATADQVEYFQKAAIPYLNRRWFICLKRLKLIRKN